MVAKKSLRGTDMSVGIARQPQRDIPLKAARSFKWIAPSDSQTAQPTIDPTNSRITRLHAAYRNRSTLL